MTEQVQSFIFPSVGATLSLLALLMFWWLAGRTVLAEVAVHSGPTFLRRIARNALVPLIAVVVARGLMWAFASYYLRVISLQDFGYYAVAVNVIGFFGPLTDFGLSVLLIRDVSRRPDAASAYVAIVQRVRLLLSLAAIPVVLLIMAGYWYADIVQANTILTAGLLAVALIPANAAGTASSLFSARERMDFTALVQIATALLTVGLGTVANRARLGLRGTSHHGTFRQHRHCYRSAPCAASRNQGRRAVGWEVSAHAHAGVVSAHAQCAAQHPLFPH